MNTGATVRMIRVSVVVLLAVLAVGALAAREAEAKPNNGTNKESISKRAKGFETDCEKYGGEADVSYGYDRKGNLESANVSCSGGILDGVNCTYTVDTSSCYNEPRGFNPGATTIRSDVLETGNTGIQSPETVEGPPGSEWGGVGSAGVAEDESSGQPTATTEATPVLTAAAPITIRIVEDEAEE